MRYGTIKGSGSGCGCEGANVFEIIGDGATTEFAITHGLNSKEILIGVRNAVSPFEVVAVPAEFTSNSVITFTFVVAPAVGEVYIVSLFRVSYSYNIVGDGATTAFTITHNLATKNIIAQIRQSFEPFAKVEVSTKFATVNTVVITFVVAPGSGVVYRVNLVPLC